MLLWPAELFSSSNDISGLFFSCWFKRKKPLNLNFNPFKSFFYFIFFWNLLILRAFRVCECVSLVLILARRVHDTRKSLTRRQKKRRRQKNSNILSNLARHFVFFFFSPKKTKSLENLSQFALDVDKKGVTIYDTTTIEKNFGICN